MDELKQISDLTEPSVWYTDARQMKRRIIYHSGPTNSGKTYSALQRFITSESGIYCGPLKLLANEVCLKCNNANTPCDLLTGEERKYADPENKPSNHLACTVEMANLEKEYEVAVIDEIQMIKDSQRGWAWTRAFLGLKAKEIHVCGDKSATELLADLSFITSDDFEIKEYERLTSLTIMDKALQSFDKVEPGDCFVCFNKSDIYTVVQNLEKNGHEVAVIYGSMPPGVKLAQAARFNDPNDKCKIMVATDAIGMGLNLNIRRIIFYSLKKPQLRERKSGQETVEIENITTSQALQIAGD
jgi:ATP-dependent RNA helicase SUPV3L1/SUV3